MLKLILEVGTARQEGAGFVFPGMIATMRVPTERNSQARNKMADSSVRNRDGGPTVGQGQGPQARREMGKKKFCDRSHDIYENKGQI